MDKLNEADKELNTLLDDIFIAHEDNDSFTCNANYITCTECNQLYYYLSGRPCNHNAKRLIGECNCSLKEEKAEAKTALLAWREREVLRELEAMAAQADKEYSRQEVDNWTFSLGCIVMDRLYALHRGTDKEQS